MLILHTLVLSTCFLLFSPLPLAYSITALLFALKLLHHCDTEPLEHVAVFGHAGSP